MISCRSRAFASLLPMLLPFSVLHADVTLRYKIEVKINSTVPAQMAAGAMKGMDSSLSREIVLRLKGGKGFSESMAYSSIIDFTTKEITYLDTAGKRYAKLAYGQYLDEVARATAEMPAAVRASLASTKVDVSPVRATGRTSVIQGVEVEEREVVFSLEAPAAPNLPAGPVVRMVMQLWTAKPGEVLRVPAIRELAGYSLWSYTTMNPITGVETLMKPWPGLADAFGPLMKELQGAHALRAHIDVFVPAIAAALERLPAGSNPLGAGFDPNAPLIQMDEEAVELSSEPVPDGLFQVPEGYQEAPIADLLKGMAAKTQTAGTASVPAAPREIAPAATPEIPAPRSLEDAANLVKPDRQAREQGKQEEGPAGASAQAADDARALLQQVANAFRATASWRIEGKIVTESKTGFSSNASTRPFRLYLQGPQMRYEVNGPDVATIFRNGSTLWEYSAANNSYTRRDNMSGRYITGVLGWDVLVAALLPTAAITGRDQVEFEGRSQECELVRSESPGGTRTLCIDRSRLLVLRDREETAAAGLGGSQTRQSVRTVTYTRIDRNPPLEASLFELPVGAVERQTGAQAALPPGLTPPILLAKVEPAYTPQANAAKRQGTVVLSLQVGPDGVPRNVTVVRGLGLGLDERAVEAVQKYRFVPAEKDGKPVAVNARVEVNFRLYSPQQ